jgi:antibiotic biosynthesis monooxygenase (ABM) superfamily enzyme
MPTTARTYITAPADPSYRRGVTVKPDTGSDDGQVPSPGVEPEVPAGPGGPVTATVTRRVKPGHEAAYEEFLTGINSAARAFPGYLGEEVFRPADGTGGEYRIIYRFDSPGHLRGWLESDERAAWLQRAEPHTAGPMRTQFLTGLESWFTLPGQASASPPPAYKMAVLTWVTIFPLITVVVVVSAPLIGGLPLAFRLAVTTLVTVTLMTWVVMPRVTRLMRGWLYPGRR